MTSCPRCGGEVVRGQEYCLECGVRLPGPALGSVDESGRGWLKRSLLALAVAAVGAVSAVAAAGGKGGGGGGTLLTATGGFAAVPTTPTVAAPGEVGSNGASAWPSGQSAWTVTLVSVPQTTGRTPALLEVRRARKAGLPQVGILDSSAYASLHPGYWIVFTGVYSSEAEATSALQPARGVSRSAAVRHVVP